MTEFFREHQAGETKILNCHMSESVSYFLMSLAVLEIPRKNLRRLEANERPSSSGHLRVPERPAVVPCATSGSGVLVRNVFPVPFELKFCRLPFRTTVFNLRNSLFYDEFI